MEDEYAESLPSRPSKSQKKREMHALQELGEELVKLSQDRLDKLDLPDALYDAVMDARRFTKHEARRRQMQFIGKVMRDIDTEPIAEQLAVIKGESATAKAEFHALERWRDRLLADDAALTEWLAQYSSGDSQQLRNLIRNARKEAAAGKPPKSSRELFRWLRDHGE
ncbi:ribosome-associated protein [Sulfuritortus calidifontis]|uniref:Dual-action ribosomal maturation protein DarP n=1 Tax=Sulfuritortus calidifontis TaxID=1914471 RepID=A0A4R3JSG7_9PROT|nr:ribosome biogenesis factor YjgA [Sulfuritortus calidifontis]TCS70023.1 ribosome-associated protein [Sulfuritortus calidifontis]